MRRYRRSGLFLIRLSSVLRGWLRSILSGAYRYHFNHLWRGSRSPDRKSWRVDRRRYRGVLCACVHLAVCSHAAFCIRRGIFLTTQSGWALPCSCLATNCAVPQARTRYISILFGDAQPDDAHSTPGKPPSRTRTGTSPAPIPRRSYAESCMGRTRPAAHRQCS